MVTHYRKSNFVNLVTYHEGCDVYSLPVERNGCCTTVRVSPTNFTLHGEWTTCTFRRELCEIVQTLLYSDSSESSSSDDEDTAILLLHAVFPLRERLHRTRVCIERTYGWIRMWLFRWAMVISKIVAIDLYMHTDLKRVRYTYFWWLSAFLSFITIPKEQSQLGWKHFWLFYTG